MRDIVKIKTAAKQAEIQSLIAAASAAGIKLQYIRHYECAQKLNKGDIVKILLYEGEKSKAIYRGSQSTGYQTWVEFRFFTAKGKPCKTTAREDYNIMEFVKKVEK